MGSVSNSELRQGKDGLAPASGQASKHLQSPANFIRESNADRSGEPGLYPCGTADMPVRDRPEIRGITIRSGIGRSMSDISSRHRREPLPASGKHRMTAPVGATSLPARIRPEIAPGRMLCGFVEDALC